MNNPSAAGTLIPDTTGLHGLERIGIGLVMMMMAPMMMVVMMMIAPMMMVVRMIMAPMMVVVMTMIAPMMMLVMMMMAVTQQKNPPSIFPLRENLL